MSCWEATPSFYPESKDPPRRFDGWLARRSDALRKDYLRRRQDKGPWPRGQSAHETAERDVVGRAEAVPCLRNAQFHRLFNPFLPTPNSVLRDGVDGARASGEGWSG